jgi:hypothetical protein
MNTRSGSSAALLLRGGWASSDLRVGIVEYASGRYGISLGGLSTRAISSGAAQCVRWL